MDFLKINFIKVTLYKSKNGTFEFCTNYVKINVINIYLTTVLKSDISS